MIEKVGNLFKHLSEYNTIVIPGNGVIRSDLTLVMGAGAAKACCLCQEPPLGKHLPMDLGASIVRVPWASTQGTDSFFYGFALSELDDRVAVLQTKRHYKDKSDLDLINFGLHIMCENLQYRKVAVFYPGIGLGGLAIEDVRELLYPLDNNYHFWRKEM